MINVKEIKKILIKNRRKFRGGISERKIKKAEKLYNVFFPQDFKILLKTYRIKSNYDWGDFSSKNVEIIKNALERPLKGIIYDIINNNFWYDPWGERPNKIDEAIEIAKEKYKSVPKLIPIHTHRYIPMISSDKDIPVISVHQTDIIYYGNDINDYIRQEFTNDKSGSFNDIDMYRYIEFWSDIM